MKLHLKLLTIYLLFFNFVTAQKRFDPLPEDVVLAKKLRETYPKNDVAVLESKEFITFDLNNKAAKVTVNSKRREKLMGINSRADIQLYESYDFESSIERFVLRYKNESTVFNQPIDEFYKDKNLFFNDVRIKHVPVDFPVQGYTYFFELEKNYKDIKYYTVYYFNDDHPVVNKEIEFSVPNWLNIELKEFNFEGFNIKKTIVQDPKKQSTTYTYKVENLNAFSNEENAPGKSYTYPHIMLVAKSFTDKNSNEVPLFKTTADLYKWYKSLVNLMKDDKTVLQEKVTALTANAKTDEEKIKNIYYWVQDNIRYIAFEDGIAGFKPEESDKVFTNRYGDCKGMGNLIKQMLVLAGFDARLTWIGTKHIAYDYTTPCLAIDNHMICTLFYKGKKYFLDGTEKFNTFGEYAERIQNKEAMIENGDSYLIEKIPSHKAEENKETFKANFSIEGEKLKGSCVKTAIGEARTQFISVFDSFETNKKGETLEKYLSNGDKNITVEKIQTTDLKNREIALKLSFDTTINNKVSSFDNELYVDLNNMKEFGALDFKDRKFDYEFDYKENYDAEIVLKIPAGYKATKIPENAEIKEDNFFGMIKYEQTPTTIVLKKTFLFKDAKIKSSQITKWQLFFEKLNKSYNQQITLTKI